MPAVVEHFVTVIDHGGSFNWDRSISLEMAVGFETVLSRCGVIEIVVGIRK